MSNAIATQATTMSSREIAELIGKQHSNIKISAERLAASGAIGTLAAQEFTHNDHAYTSTKFTPKGVSWIAGEWAKHCLAADLVEA